MKRFNKRKAWLTLLAILCSLFALRSYYRNVYKPDYNRVIKCEGIVLNSAHSYHITNKNKHSELRAIRGETVSIADQDLLLHYRDKEMELMTPSYWGTLFYRNGWQYKLDHSFAHDAKDNGSVLLPFLCKKKHGQIHYVRPDSTLREAALLEDASHYINTHAGTPSTRFYLRLRELNDKLVFPWYDDGIKQRYLVKRLGADTLGVFFNAQAEGQYADRNFVFDNTSRVQGRYQLITQARGLTLLNSQTGERREINTPYFEVGDMMFSIQPRFTFWEQVQLFARILILIGSLFFFLVWAKEEYELHPSLNGLRIGLLCLYLLGDTIFALSFSNSGSWWRELILTLATPFVPLASYYLPRWRRMCEWLVSKGWLKASRIRGIEDTLRKAGGVVADIWNKGWKYKYIFLGLLFVASCFLLSGAREERVGFIPVLHFFKLILLLSFYFLYSPWVVACVGKRTWTRWFYLGMIMIVAVGATTLTGDYGVSVLVLLSFVLFEYIRGGVSLKSGVMCLLGYFAISGVLLILAKYLTIEKLYRLTFTWANPGNELLYGHVPQGHRESISILFHNIKLVCWDNFWGIENLLIPQRSMSVSHTDFALHWSFVANGFLFLALFFMAFVTFCYNAVLYLGAISLETNQTERSLTSVSVRHRSFISFVLVLMLAQGIAPIMSNLLLPGAFLTGVPCPGISVSNGDTTLFLILFIAMEQIVRAEIADRSQDFKEALMAKAKSHSRGFVIGLIVPLVCFGGLKYLLCYYQDENTEIVGQSMVSSAVLDCVSHTTSQEDIWSFSQAYFGNKDVSALGAEDKADLRVLLKAYFNGSVLDKTLKTDFRISLAQQKRNLSLDSLMTFQSVRISGDKWRGSEVVYARDILINGKHAIVATHEAFSSIAHRSQALDKDATANINVALKTHLSQRLRSYPRLKASVLVVENATGHIIINSAYPFESSFPHREYSFYPGSVKKVLLAHYFSRRYTGRANDAILQTPNAQTPMQWIAKSDNEATMEVFNTYVATDMDSFASFLREQHRLPFISNYAEGNGYAEVAWNGSALSRQTTLIGGRTKYTPETINRWLQTLSREAFADNQLLYAMLNAPLNRGGTATNVAEALRKQGLDTKDFICKTGTLEEGSRNLSTAFAIAGRAYSITVLIDGVQPDNKQGVAAKHLFVKIIRDLHPYLQ